MRPPASPPEPVAGAAVDAVLAARWEVAELLSRRPSRLAADLLRGRAAELASSALASDQVLSLALDTAAADIEAGFPPLGQGALFLRPDADVATGRQSMRAAVMRHPGDPEPPPADLVAQIERRLEAQRLTRAEVSARLAAEARLQEALWDDPRLPAQASIRLAMLCSIPRFRERAAELDPVRPRAYASLWTRRRWTPVGMARRTGSRRRWPPRQIGWLLVGGLFAVALVIAGEPVWRGLLHLAAGAGA